METIFDFNPTPYELRQVTGSVKKELYLELFGNDSRCRDLAMLFYLRDDKKMMKYYADRISNISMRNSFYRTINHP